MGELRHSDFRPAWWIRGPHLQTLWPSLFRRRPRLNLERRRIELADGDFLDLAVGPGSGPAVVVIHGLEGDLRSHYAGGTLSALAAAGFRPIFMHLRGRSGECNRLPRSYHSGATEDLAAVLDDLAGGPEGPPLAAVGFSLGGNLLLKYLGETPEPGIRAAVAVSVPFVLRDAALRLNLGASRLYRRHLLGRLKDSYRTKFSRMPSPLDVDLEEIRDLFDYDDRITAPLHGFAGAEDYYARASCRPFLRHISTPTLILHSADDPFMFAHTVPRARELGRQVTMELAERGGHVGFVSGALPWRPHYWLETRILDYLRGLIG
ncbi:MAG: hydrolase [Pseudomonadota bacterium]|nr:hydrolase [Pseudomonadota bacterium]